MIAEEGYYPRTRMEEAEEGEEPQPPIGFASSDLEQEETRRTQRAAGPREALLSQLLQERQAIVNNQELSTKEKLGLLESNRKTIVVTSGGTVRRTENVVYGILIFGGGLVVILALLTVFADLPSEITLTFVGTVLGGTIATIAQKLGKI